MNNQFNSLAIGVLIIKTLEKYKTFIDEETRATIKLKLLNFNEMELGTKNTTIEEVIEILSRYPKVSSDLIRELKSMESNYSETDQIRNFIGDLTFGMPTHSLYVCPVDSEHYRRRIDAFNEDPICPLHKVKLVING